MAVDTRSLSDLGAALSGDRLANDPRVKWRPSAGGYAARLTVHALIIGTVLAAPALLPGIYTNVISRAFVFGIVALSMNILIGYTGQISLGHQAFFGVGAFASGYAITNLTMPFGAALVVAMVVGAVTAVALGVIALRIKGLYLALVTITFGLFAERVVFSIPAITGGGAGMEAARPTWAQGDLAYAYVCFAALVLVWLFDWRLTSSKAGRAIEALRDDERVAASWGISITSFKLLAFVLSGVIAGLAGGLFASIEQVVSPITFSFQLGLIFVIMTVVGGIRSRPGVVIGGFVFATLATILTVAHETPGWGIEGEGGLGVSATLPPRIIQLVLGLALVGAAAELVRHGVLHSRGVRRVVLGVVALGVVGLGGWVALGGFLGYFSLFKAITADLEPLIGALLLLITLIQFPGGIAQQLAPLLRWLRFQPLHGEETATVGGGSAGGSMGARP
ncbi:MAG: branched-chain amino acid ABC transporter permease [Actinomycetes bacterium]